MWSRAMSKKGKIIIVLGIILILIILVVVNIKRSTGGTIKVQVGKVKRGDITQVVSGSGRVQPEVQVKISANVSGKIVKLHVKEGEQVKKGQILVELDRTRYEAAVDQAKSNLKSAKASLKKARSEYRRFQELYEKNLCSLADLESAEASLLLAESNVEQAEASLKQAADDLSKTTLISPIDGTVTKLNKEEGEIALGSMFQEDVIMIVADLSKMEVVTEIDENDVVLVSLGDKAKIEVDAIPDTIFEGRVSEIAHTATTRGMGTAEEVTNFEVKVAIEGGAQQLRPGMSATVDIETETHRNVLHIPIQCVTMRMPKAETEKPSVKKYQKTNKGKASNQEGKNAGNQPDEETDKPKPERKLIQVVFVAENGFARMVPVETGISNDTDIEIISGLKEGQQVITGSYKALSKLLKDGSKIKVSKAAKFRKETEK
ncbi:efflux RND transporter periplasmic adaptor subunit [candidate division KSB1 bacterium]|nr:MAG: hypothetical protein B5M50_01945 [candidate division KSB1 bacterium 4484_219]RKY92182.1 MAG: efflux RND transporter periplasmic adaptor subunit [candidate division KSB1 bacterium]